MPQDFLLSGLAEEFSWQLPMYLYPPSLQPPTTPLPTPTCPFIYLSIHSSIHPSPHLSIHLPVHPSIYPSIHPPTHPCTHHPIHPSMLIDPFPTFALVLKSYMALRVNNTKLAHSMCFLQWTLGYIRHSVRKLRLREGN